MSPPSTNGFGATSAVIVAGGRGTRMRSVSETVPKVLLPIGGRPILVRQLEWLRRFGIEDVVLCLGHQAAEVREALGDGSRWDLSLHYAEETTPRGTAGAVRDVADRLDENALIVYGDLLVELDLTRLLEFHASHDALATIVVRETDHPRDSDLVRVGRSGRVTDFLGKGYAGDLTGTLGCTAIWVIRRPLLERVHADAPSDFARDVFPRVLADGDGLMAYLTRERVKDLGTPERYEAMRRELEG